MYSHGFEQVPAENRPLLNEMQHCSVSQLAHWDISVAATGWNACFLGVQRACSTRGGALPPASARPPRP
eukprot:6179301-Pleurochrysis_carterae.AAC.4